MNEFGIGKFLEPLGLIQYAEIFKIKGFDVETDICNIDEEDLTEMGIEDIEHRQLILHAAHTHQLSEECEVFLWLREIGLDYYFSNFMSGNFHTLRDIASMDPTPEVLRELEVELPAHRKRLRLAIPKLRKRRRIDDAEAATPLAIGYWGKPPTLEGAKFDFLCIHATLRSLKPDGQTFKEVFMVDSGSDVVTARQEILDSLDLELIGTIQSRGVHTTVEKQLYKAMLVIGNHEVEIEVMAEPYESIGNRVMRHFRHVIDSTVHYWLPENRVEPSEGMTSSRSEPTTSGESGGTLGSPESEEAKEGEGEDEEEEEGEEEGEEEEEGDGDDDDDDDDGHGGQAEGGPLEQGEEEEGHDDDDGDEASAAVGGDQAVEEVINAQAVPNQVNPPGQADD
ncbi:uncharacterized protein [Diadema antillarum]|uniref:uncharacterized protein n=2 Tax=Diadema antillarum TaxID=105358 RepID=UPI003A8972A3